MKQLILKIKIKQLLFKCYRQADHVGIDRGEELPENLVFHYDGHYTGLITRMLTVLGWLDYAERKKRKLIVLMTDEAVDTSDENIWNRYFLQPMSCENCTYDDVEKKLKDGNAVKLPLMTRYHFKFDRRFRNIMKVCRPGIWFPTPDDYRNRPAVHERYRNLYRQYIRFTDEVKEYLNLEYHTVLEGKGRILGIKCRGTDYVQQRPYNHPVQPSPEEVIDFVRTLPPSAEWDFIYLATEEKAIEDKFKAAFPDRILINRRQYYDGDYSERVLSDAVADRKEMFRQDIEYLSTIYLLSKCDMLAAGMCGGTEAAMIMKEGEYEYLHIFEKGCYGVGKNR